MTQVSLYTANLAHGANTGGGYDYANQANILSSADIVGAQEVTPGDLSSWDIAFTANGFNSAIYFPNSSGPNNTGDGQAIWYRASKVTLLQAYSHQLSTGFISWDGSTNVDKSAVAVKVAVANRSFIIVNTHLCWSRCADTQADIETTGYSRQRVAQINELLAWIDTEFSDYVGRVVLLADMNFTPAFLRQPSGYQIDLLTVNYTDLWQQGLVSGRAFAEWGDRDNDGIPDMPLGNLTTRTADKRRVDYIFLSNNSTILSLDRIEVPDLRVQCPNALVFDGGNFPSCSPVRWQWDVTDDYGVRPSDHNWVKTVLTIH